MLSYQHIYHAGNFADVQKHAVLARLLHLLAQKPQGFTFLDTHAGRGLYDLSNAEAQKLGEFKSGVLPFFKNSAAHAPLAAYLGIVAACNPEEDGGLRFYPGSAEIAWRLMRRGDNLLLIERHPGEFEELKKSFEGRINTKIEKEDGFARLVSAMPLAGRRGLVLIDPSYEIKSEYETLPKQLEKAYMKWPQGQFMIWYPHLPEGLHKAMLAALRRTRLRDILVSEIYASEAPATSEAPAIGMSGTGVIVVNPPFGFETALKDITAHIADALPFKAQGDVYWLDNCKIDSLTGFSEGI